MKYGFNVNNPNILFECKKKSFTNQYKFKPFEKKETVRNCQFIEKIFHVEHKNTNPSFASLHPTVLSINRELRGVGV